VLIIAAQKAGRANVWSDCPGRDHIEVLLQRWGAQSRPCCPNLSAFPLEATELSALALKAYDRILGHLQETRKIKEKVPDEDARKPALRQLLHKVSPGASSWSPGWYE
jgi:hypothetical protein